MSWGDFRVWEGCRVRVAACPQVLGLGDGAVRPEGVGDCDGRVGVLTRGLGLTQSRILPHPTARTKPQVSTAATSSEAVQGL
jgi:hypothetical protein